MDRSSAEELLERARAGSVEAGDQLLLDYANDLLPIYYKRFVKRGRTIAGPDDFLQEMRAALSRARVTSGVYDSLSSFYAYLRKVAHNTAVQMSRRMLSSKADLRRETLVSPPEPVDPEPTPEQELTAREEWERFLDKLGPEEKEALELAQLQKTVKHIAHRVGRSERSIRRLFSRVFGACWREN